MEKFLSLDSTLNTLRNWIFDTDTCQDRSTIFESRFSMWYPKLQISHMRPQYLRCYLFHSFTESSLNLDFKRIPVMERKCVYGCNRIEDIIHYLLFCPLYKIPRDIFLLPITQMFPNCPHEEIV
ncbi:hypothetical protein JRQ81_017137, partial [Phrynocephalus forsythii]